MSERTSLTGDDITGILTQRLALLRDESRMVPALARALAAMMSAPPRVVGYSISYCKIKPNRDINLVANVTLEGHDEPQRLSATVYATPADARKHFAQDEQIELSGATRAWLARRGFEHPVVLLEDPDIILRAFPVDPLLPGLAPAIVFEEMKPRFEQHLLACTEEGREATGFSYQILHYKPRRSCTVHYRLELGPATGGQPAKTVSVFGKVARDDRGERNYQVLETAWRASRSCAEAWRAARPVAYVPEWRLLLQEAVAGRDFRVVFNELTRDDATDAELARVRGNLVSIVEAVRSLQVMPVGPDDGPEKSFERLFAEQEKNLDYLRGSEPGLASQIGAIRDELARLEPLIPRGPRVFCHGDFAHGNVLIDDEEVGIIDFDKSGIAEPAYDAAYFLTHMWSFGIRHPNRMGHVRELWKYLRESYLALAPEVCSRRLALYEALDFAAYVLRNFRKQSHQASWMTWAEGQISAAWDRLHAAADDAEEV